LKSPGSPGLNRSAAIFFTYVLWAASPDGRTDNLGEIQPDKSGKGKIQATTQLQTFSLFVTAEPYFAVSHPSELIVLETKTFKSTKGRIFCSQQLPSPANAGNMRSWETRSRFRLISNMFRWRCTKPGTPLKLPDRTVRRSMRQRFYQG